MYNIYPIYPNHSFRNIYNRNDSFGKAMNKYVNSIYHYYGENIDKKENTSIEKRSLSTDKKEEFEYELVCYFNNNDASYMYKLMITKKGYSCEESYTGNLNWAKKIAKHYGIKLPKKPKNKQ